MAPTIVVVIPTRGLVHSATIEATQAAIARLAVERPAVNVLPVWAIAAGYPIPDSHNEAARRGLASGADLLLWIEEDNVPPEEGIVRMLDLLEAGADWAFVDYPVTATQRGTAGKEMCYHYSLPEGRVLWTGLGTTLIKRRVFEELVPAPWFRTDASLRVSDWGTAQERIAPSRYGFKGVGGQDILFGWDATRAGARIAVVPELTGGQVKLVKRGAEGTNDGAHTYEIWR